MKKNVVPLVIIALVVAVAATGIFYGLIVSRMDAKAQAAPQLRLVANGNFDKGRVIEKGDLRLAEVPASDGKGKNSAALEKPEQVIGRSLLENLADGQPFSDRVLSPYRRRNLDGGIPTGMRAATIHVADSSSVIEMIEAGDRIDIQSISSQQSYGQGTSFQVKTVLENVLVYGLGARETSQQFGQRSILTLLVSPAEAEKLAYADAASRLRVTLRNRQDNGRLSAPLLSPKPIVTSKFQVKSPEVKSLDNKSLDSNQDFEVQLYEVPSGAFKNTDQLEISSGEWRKKLESLAASSQARLWASSRIESSRGGQLSWQGSDPAASVAVRVESIASNSANQADLRIQPSVSLADTGKESVRQTSKQLRVDGTQSALVSGLIPREQWTSWRQKFSPGGSASPLAPDSGLVLLITPLNPTQVKRP